MQLSPTLQEISRTHPQSSELFLSIFQPTTVLTAIVTGTGMTRGSRTIPYVATSGSYLSIESGMTLLVGSTPGARDIGKIRIKSATSGNIVVAENSNIPWSNFLHLTVLRYFEVWPVYPRIIPDPGNAENVIFYKDYDTAYTNQNSILGSFPCAGNHRALWVGESTYWGSTGTTHLLGSALTYDWAFEGGAVTGSTSATPGNITYNTPGHYVTRLIVTGANGSVDTTYRYVSVYNKPENSSSNNPILKWNVDTVSGSRGEGGYNTNIKVIDNPISLYDGDVVVLFGEDYYGSNKVSLGGNSPNNSSIFFTGHIIRDTIRYDYKTSSVDFSVGSISEIMKLSEGFSVSVESKATPTKWFELLDMDGRRALYHYLRWHTTVLYLADFQFLGTDYKIQFFDSDRQSMFDAVDNYMRGTLLGSLVADRQGKLWAEVGAWAYSNPTGSFPPIQTLEKRDWLGEPTIEERLTPPLSFLELGGVAYSGTSTGTFSAFISNAPGSVPNTRGNTDIRQGLALGSQAQLNTLSGNIFANENSKYPSIELDLAGNYRQLDIAPQITLDVNVSPTDTTRNITIHAPYLVNSLSWMYDSRNKIMLPQTGLISVVNGIDGETILIPDVPDGGGYGGFGGGFNFNPSFGGIPPFLSSLGSGIIGQWASDILNENSALGMDFNSQIYNYGAAGYSPTLATGTSTISQIAVTTSGIYFLGLRVFYSGGAYDDLTAFNISLKVGATAGYFGMPFYFPSGFVGAAGGSLFTYGYKLLFAGNTVTGNITGDSALFTALDWTALLDVHLIRTL